MQVIRQVAERFSTHARQRRGALFRATFMLDERTRILDLGSGNGEHIHMTLAPTNVAPQNVYIADINPRSIAEGHARFGFQPVQIGENGALPFPDRFFDIVHCSSVIEHVTVPKRDVWAIVDETRFRREAGFRQRQFAKEISRLGRQYFVQTPNRNFPIESHSWLPFVGHLPRHWLLPLLTFTNRFYPKKTSPDWHLLDRYDLEELFDDATILEERSLGLVKSLMAVRIATPASTPAAAATRTARSGARP